MDLSDLLAKQRQTILSGDTERAVELAHEALGTGADVLACIDRGFVAGIREVGRLWAEGEYFLPELVQGAEAMKAALAVLRPELLKLGTAYEQRTRVVLGAVKGDIHDIGKSLVGTVFEANGFEVVDLGRDVPDETFVETVESAGARILGMSALLTTTMSGQRRVIDLLNERGLREGLIVLVGGAPVTRRFADEIGADGYAANAMAALAEARRLMGDGAMSAGLARLWREPTVLLDGGMGSALIARGLTGGGCSELLERRAARRRPGGARRISRRRIRGDPDQHLRRQRAGARQPRSGLRDGGAQPRGRVHRAPGRGGARRGRADRGREHRALRALPAPGRGRRSR